MLVFCVLRDPYIQALPGLSSKKLHIYNDLCGVPLTDDCLLGELLGPEVGQIVSL